MDEGAVFCWILLLGSFFCFVLFRIRWEQKRIGAAREEWLRAGYAIRCAPSVVWCYSALPPKKGRRYGAGVLGITDEGLLFLTTRGETEVIPLSGVCWIAAGNMWRRSIGGGRYGPFLIVDYENLQEHQTLAFHSSDNIRMSEYLSQHHELTCGPIPHGFRVWNGRLIRPG